MRAGPPGAGRRRSRPKISTFLFVTGLGPRPSAPLVLERASGAEGGRWALLSAGAGISGGAGSCAMHHAGDDEVIDSVDPVHFTGVGMDLDHRGGRVGQVEPPRFGAGGVVGQLGGALWSDDRLQGECPDGAVPHPGDDVVIGVGTDKPRRDPAGPLDGMGRGLDVVVVPAVRGDVWIEDGTRGVCGKRGARRAGVGSGSIRGDLHRTGAFVQQALDTDRKIEGVGQWRGGLQGTAHGGAVDVRRARVDAGNPVGERVRLTVPEFGEFRVG